MINTPLLFVLPAKHKAKPDDVIASASGMLSISKIFVVKYISDYFYPSNFSHLFTSLLFVYINRHPYYFHDLFRNLSHRTVRQVCQVDG